MAFRRSHGGFAESSNSVSSSPFLACTLPGIRFTNELLLMLTMAPAANGTSTVTTGPGASWTTLFLNVGVNMKMSAWVRLVDGTETSPSITWGGLTIGTGGSPAIACCMCIAGLQQSVTGIADVVGTPMEQAASSTIQAGGNGITTVTPNAVVFLIAARTDDDIIGGMDNPPATEFPWTRLDFEWTTSGADAGFEMYWGTKVTPGAIAAKTLSMTGATSDTSTGIMFALKPGPPIYSPYMSVI